MAKWTGLGDNTELFWAVLSQLAHAVASATKGLGQWFKVGHAVKITLPLWSLAITPTPAAPVDSTNDP
jgi:hypothetical protein